MDIIRNMTYSIIFVESFLNYYTDYHSIQLQLCTLKMEIIRYCTVSPDITALAYELLQNQYIIIVDTNV